MTFLRAMADWIRDWIFLSVLADICLHLKDVPITIIKRPPSANNHSNQVSRVPPKLTFGPQYPFEYHWSRVDDSQVASKPNSRSSSKYRLSEEMWEKIQTYQDVPTAIIKRQQTTNSNQVSRVPNKHAYAPQCPFDYYLSRAEESQVVSRPNLRCSSKYDRLSEEIWEKFQTYQQTSSTYRKKILMWKDLYNAVKVSTAERFV